ncbi:MAG: hypothetical protein IPK53_09230 [bacterium]|nr:hypothetical protein [bacterium]
MSNDNYPARLSNANDPAHAPAPGPETLAIYGDQVAGDKVGGDKFDVVVESSQAVAIGAGARATLNQYTEIIVKIDTLEDVPPAPGEPPYKGLAYFTEQDKDIFFGREKLSDHLANRMGDSHFLALIGASGSGKSSLLRAGLIPVCASATGSSILSSPAFTR